MHNYIFRVKMVTECAVMSHAKALFIYRSFAFADLRADWDIHVYKEKKKMESLQKEEEKRRDLQMLQEYHPWGKPAGGAPRVSFVHVHAHVLFSSYEQTCLVTFGSFNLRYATI